MIHLYLIKTATTLGGGNGMLNRILEWLESLFTKQLSTKQVMKIAAPQRIDPPWLATARRELGTSEICGKGANKRIIEYHASTSLKAMSDEVSWCSSFVNWCFKVNNINGTNKANARSWMKWGCHIDKPVNGCVCVFWRVSVKDWRGHVGFYVGHDDTHVHVLGGNQGDRVSVKRYPKKRLLGYRLCDGSSGAIY